MNMSKKTFNSLPLDIKESIKDIEEVKQQYDKDPNDISLRIILKEVIYDLSLSCKWHRIEGDISKEFLDELENSYWRYLL